VPCFLVLALSAWPANAKRHSRTQENRTQEPSSSHRKQTSVLSGGARVVYLTAHTAYVGLGSEEGVRVGMALALQRRGQTVANCQIAAVSPHSASCASQAGIRLGDSFAPPEPPRKEKAAEVKPLPPMPTREQVAHAKTALAAQPFEQVAFANGRQSTFDQLAARHLRTELNLGEGYFAVNNQSSSTFFVQSVSAAARDTELAGGFHTSIDLTALTYFQRPPTYRFPNSAPTQLYVRQLELSYRTPNSSWAFAGGRIWPYQAPGVGVLDGVQAGWRSSESGLEAGLLGGTNPNPVTTAPTLNPVFGVYFDTTRASQGIDGAWFQAQSVITAREIPGVGYHLALDALALWSIGKWLDTSAEVRVGAGAIQAPALIDFATLNLNARPTEHNQLSASVRYIDDAVDQLLQPGAIGFTNASLNADARWSYAFSGVSVTALGVFNRDIVAGIWRAIAGAEFGVPFFLGHTAGLGVGFDENFGWSAGRDAYVETTIIPGQAFQLLLRGSYLYSWTPVTPTSPAENGVSALIEPRFRLAGWLSIQATFYAQAALTPNIDGAAIPLGFNAAASATMRF
jgi:hypothetical protein